MQLIVPQSSQSRPAYTLAPRIPIRSRAVAPDGTIIRVPINESAPDAHTIIAAMQFVIDQYGRDATVRAFVANQVVRSRVNNDVSAHTRTIFLWVVNHMVYLADPDGAEYIQSPRLLLETIQRNGSAYGDCDDHVVLLGSLLQAVGVPAFACGVKIGGTGVYDHVVIQLSDGTILDPCAKNTAPPFYGERLLAV